MSCIPLRTLLAAWLMLPLMLVLTSPAMAADMDAQRIMQANIDRPGIIPAEIVRLAQTNPDAVSFCVFDNGELMSSETCAQVIVDPKIISPEEFPQPLPCNVNAVFVAGLSSASGNLTDQDPTEQENLLLLSHIVDSRTDDRIPREQGVLSLIYRGVSGRIKLYSNGGSVSRVGPLLCENYINRELPPSIGEPPAYESYLFEDLEGQLRAEVDLIDDRETVRVGSPRAGCQDVTKRGIRGLPYTAVEFSEEALMDLSPTTFAQSPASSSSPLLTATAKGSIVNPSVNKRGWDEPATPDNG